MENTKNVVGAVIEGTATRTLMQGANAELTGDLDNPFGIGGPAKLISRTKSGGTTTAGAGGVNFNFDFSSVKNYFSSGGGSSSGQGLAWFSMHLKEIAIVAAGAALIAGIAKLIKSLNKSIKVRYNRVVKTLQKAQLDFVTNPAGLDMRSVMPGTGSRFADFFARVWTMNFGKKRMENSKKYNIGLYPFCERYIGEVAQDFNLAVQSFNKIPLTKESGDSSTAKAESTGVVYNSFREAYASDYLVEGKLDEVALLAAISAGVGLASVMVKAGQFVMTSMKNGKEEQKTVQVTKESVREICYAIIFNYMDKYVNMEQVFKSIGIDSNSLADLDASSVDKLKEVLEKYSKPEKNEYTKQYGRLLEAYKQMLNHYYKIGDGVIANFAKYTKTEDEKHANLLVESKEKLQNMWDAQKDMFNNNFSHVLIEIVSSPVYIAYLNFIIEKVLPVFKSGLAGDADYVLDVLPAKNQYYLLRQTESQPWLEGDETNKGNYAIAKVVDFDQKTKEIEFKLVCLFGGKFKVSDQGVVTIDESESLDGEKDNSIYNYDVYKDKEDVKLPFNKWMSLDPLVMDWQETLRSDIYTRYVDAESHLEKDPSKATGKQYIYFSRNRSDILNSNGAGAGVTYDMACVGTYDIRKKSFINCFRIKLTTPLSVDEVKQLVGRVDEDPLKNMKFDEGSMDSTFYRMADAKFEDKEAANIDEVSKIVNESDVEMGSKVTSVLYKRDATMKDGAEYTEYVYASLSGDLESVMTGSYQRLNDGTINEDEKPEYAEVKPEDKKGEEDLVSSLFVCRVKKGAEISSAEDASFAGAVVTIKPACSVKDLDTALEGLSPAFSADDIKPEESQKKKEAIKKAIEEYAEAGGTQVKDTYEISKIQDAIEAVFTKKSSTPQETLEENAEKIAEKIIASIKEKGSDNIEDYVSGTITDPQNNTATLSRAKEGSVYRLSDSKVGESGAIEIDTEIKDEEDHPITISVYPVRIDDAAQLPNGDKAPETSKPFVILIGKFGDKSYITSGPNDENEIKTKIVPALIEKMVKDGEQDDENFKFTDKKAPATELDEDTIKKIDELIKANVKVSGTGEGTKYAVDADVTEGNFSIVNEKDDKPGVIVTVKYGEESDKSLQFSIEPKAKGDKVVTTFTLGDGKIAYVSDSYNPTEDNIQAVTDVVDVYNGKKEPVKAEGGRENIDEETIKTVDELIKTNVKLKEEGDKVSYTVDDAVDSDGITILQDPKDPGVLVTIKYGPEFSKSVQFKILARKDGDKVKTGFILNNGNVAYASYDYKPENGSAEALTDTVDVYLGKKKPIEPQKEVVEPSDEDIKRLDEVVHANVKLSGANTTDASTNDSTDASTNGAQGNLSQPKDIKYYVENPVAKNNVFIITTQTGVMISLKYGESFKNSLTLGIKAKVENGKMTSTEFYDGNGTLAMASESFDIKTTSLADAVKSIVALEKGQNPGEQKPAEQQGQQNQPVQPQTNVQNQAKPAEQTTAQPEEKEKEEEVSASVSYEFKNSVYESNSMKTTIERKLNKDIKGYSVISESVFDDGSGRRTLLESERFRKSLKTRKDVMSYVKSNADAMIKEAKKSVTYSIYSDMGYKPSKSTPLYESTMLVKFDADGKVMNKVYLGKNKIG